MDDVAYFTAVLASFGASWKARDVEVDETQTLDDLADSLRSVAADDEPVLAVVEHEDEWFALVRVDGDDEPRLFVSDLFAASRSPFGELLAPAADVDNELEDDVSGEGSGADSDDLDDVDEESDVELRKPSELQAAAWAGELDLLEDLGVAGKELRRLVELHSDDPAQVLGELGEAVGFADQLAALR